MNDQEREKLWERLWSARRGNEPATALEIVRRLVEDREQSDGTSIDEMLSYLHADSLRELGRYSESEGLLQSKEFASAGLLTHVQVLLGQCANALGRIAEAEEWFRAATRSYPESPGAWIWLSTVLAKRGQDEQALDVLRQGLESVTSCRDELYLNLGRLFRSRRNYVKAIESYQSALELTPGYAPAAEDLRDVRKALKMSDARP